MAETAQDYIRWTNPLRRNPKLVRALIWANSVLTALGYIAYPLLLVLLAIFAPDKIARAIIVPAISFVAVSIFRYIYNAPRPYEALAIDPLIKKDTHGKSFPSRHTFCMFMIAATWFYRQPLVGVILGISGCFMAVVRVLGGVHFPRDVIVGAIVAIACALIGYCV